MKVSSIAPVLLLLLSLGGCGSGDAPTAEPVRLGVVVDQTGSVARPQWTTAARLAVENANAGLRQAGRSELQFELLFSDSNNSSSVALERAQKLRDQGVKGLVTDTTEDAVAMLETPFDSNGENDIAMPIVCMACTAPTLFDPNAVSPAPKTRMALRNAEGWGFRTVMDLEPETRRLIQYFLDDLPNGGDTNGDGQQKIAVEIINDLEGTDFLQGLKDARDELFPGIIIEEVRHQPNIGVDGHDWNGDLIQLTNDRNEARLGQLDGQPDAIFEATFPLFAAALSRSYQEAGQDVGRIPFVHHHHWRNDQILQKLGAFDLENKGGPTRGTPQQGISHIIVDNCDSAGRIFTQEMRARTGRDPGYLDSNTYDAVMTLLLGALVAVETNDLAEPAALTPAQLREGMGRLSGGDREILPGPDGFAEAVEAVRAGESLDYVGASGPVDFDENGNVVGNFVKYEVRDGRFVDLATYDCRADPTTCPEREFQCDL
jgi:hypothetical protein